MKILKLRLQPQVPLNSAPTGAEFAQFLVNEAGLDSARIRARVEEACMMDLMAYFEYKKIEYTKDWLLSLMKAELAGGAFAVSNIPERLRRKLTQESTQIIAEIAADISILLQDKRSDFNYFRYSLNAVVTVMGDLFKETLFEIRGIKKEKKEILQDELEQILKVELSSEMNVRNWLDRIASLQYQVINLHESEDLPQNKASVSTKSMSTYRLRVYDYTMMQSKKFISTPELANQLSEFEQRLNKYLRAKPLAIAELKQLITKNKSRKEQIDKYLDAVKGKRTMESAEIVSVTESLSRQRKMKVSYSGTGVSQRLIKPVINSLKSQLVISPNQRNWKSEAKSGPEFLSVEIEDLKNEDLVRIEKILNLHAE